MILCPNPLSTPIITRQDPDRVVLLDLDLCRDTGPPPARCEAAAAAALAECVAGEALGADDAAALVAAALQRLWGTAGYLAYELLTVGAGWKQGHGCSGTATWCGER